MCTKITQWFEILSEEPMPFLYSPMLSCFSLPNQEWKPFSYVIQEKLKKLFSYIFHKKLKKPFSYKMFHQKWFDPYFHQGSFTLCSERNSVLKSIELCTPFLFLTCKHNIYFYRVSQSKCLLFWVTHVGNTKKSLFNYYLISLKYLNRYKN